MADASPLVDELRSTLGKLELALGAIEDALVWTNEAGLIQWCNAPFDALVGRPHLRSLGAPLAELLPLSGEDGRPVPARSYPAAAALERPEGRKGVYGFLQGGARLDLEVFSAGIRTGRREASAVLVIRDITEERRTARALERSKEAAEAAYQELEVFSYSVAHDLRAPLRKIDGYSCAMLEDYADKVDDRGKQYLERLRAASQAMARLIDDLLNLSRVARSELRREQVDLSAMARAAAVELRETDPTRLVEFAIQPGMTAEADPRLIADVIDNLFGNAWKFTSRHPRARIEFGTVERDGRRAFFVRDDGAGFDPAFGAKLFVPFQRLHDPADFPGTGVGLATAQRIIRRHQGRIWAEAAVEKGATFYFTLGQGG